MQNHFDLLVIGAGSGGLAAAQMAASYGAKTALIEEKVIGGTCVNVGCVPKKIMWYAGELAELQRFGKAFGLKMNKTSFHFQSLVERRERYIEKLRHIYAERLQKSKIHYIKGSASFLDAHTLLVNKKSYTADKIIIASGCRPEHPPVKGAEWGIDSDDFFALKRLPKRVALIGSGYIAVELASILNQLGSEVVLLLRHERPLRHFDESLGKMLMTIMTAQGIQLLPHHSVQEIKRDAKKKLTVVCGNNKSISKLDAVLYAIGRTPQTASLNLEAASVKVDPHGFVITDRNEKTNISHIYAIGDVTGKKLLTPVAIAAGRRLSARIFGKVKQAPLDYDKIPTVVFTHPPVASIGLSEEAAVEKYGKKRLSIYKTQFNSLFYSLSEEKIPTLIKLITLKPDEKIIGCHLIGKSADEILQGFAVAIHMGATKKDLDTTLAIHPTSAEELVTLKQRA